MDSVELVKQICKARGIAISRLERDCGFANGYIRRLREGKFPSDRLVVIAQYLDVPLDYLIKGTIPDTGATCKRLEYLSEQKGMTLREVGQTLGIDTEVWSPECSPDAMDLKQIADYFGVTVEYILDDPKYSDEEIELAARIHSDSALRDLMLLAVTSRTEDVKLATQMLRRLSSYSKAISNLMK